MKSSSKQPLQKVGRFFHQLGRMLYIVGIQTVRIIHRLQRRLRRFFTPVRQFFARGWYYLFGRHVQWVRNEAIYLRRASLASVRKLKQLKAGNRPAYGSELRRFLSWIGRHMGRAAGWVVNLAAPVLALILLVNTAQYWMGQSYGLSLEFNGKPIGLVANEGNVGDVINMVSDRIQTGSSVNTPNITPTYTLKPINKEDHFTSYNALIDTIVTETDDHSIEQATGLYVDDEFVAAIRSRTDLRFILQKILKESESEDGTLNAAFVQDVELLDGMYTTESILSSPAMQTLLTTTQEVEQTYTVREGDAPLSIAAKLGMTLTELQSLNPERDLVNDPLHVGDKLVISGEKGFFTIKQVKEVSYTKTIPYETITQKTNRLYIGSSRTVTKGVNGEAAVVDLVTYVDGVEVDRENISSTVTKAPVNKVVQVGTAARPTIYTSPVTGTSGSSGKLMWPVPSTRVISDGFGYVSGRYHGAIDVMCSYATVVAADAGQVIQCGWHYGYGWMILLQHDNGTQTFYAHLSSLKVTPGQKVSKGQTIAVSGNSGAWSTGAHLHFEVRVGGIKVNPLKYLR